MSKYLLIGAAGFLMGVKYRQSGKRRCLRFIKKYARQLMP